MSTTAAAAKRPIRSMIPAGPNRPATTHPRPAASPTIGPPAAPVFPRLPATDAGTPSAAESATADAVGGRWPVDQERGVHRFRGCACGRTWTTSDVGHASASVARRERHSRGRGFPQPPCHIGRQRAAAWACHFVRLSCSLVRSGGVASAAAVFATEPRFARADFGVGCRGCARVRFHEWLSRHRERGRDVDRDGGVEAAGRGVDVGGAELRRGVHFDQRRGDDREGDREPGGTGWWWGAGAGVGGVDRGDPLESDHVVSDDSVEFESRVDRWGDRSDGRRGRVGRGQRS